MHCCWLCAHSSTWWHAVHAQAFTHPEKTIGKGPLHVKEHGLGGVGGSQLSYRLERLDDDKKLHTVEIFRNAYAVDKCGSSTTCFIFLFSRLGAGMT